MQADDYQDSLKRSLDKKATPWKSGVPQKEPMTNCQSCGSSILDRNNWGTRKDGRLSETYCIFCYRNGIFTEPKLTMEEMGWRIHRLLVQQGNMNAREAASAIDRILPVLARWREGSET